MLINEATRRIWKLGDDRKLLQAADPEAHSAAQIWTFVFGYATLRNCAARHSQVHERLENSNMGENFVKEYVFDILE
jgi:hypothetical protein